MTRMLLTAGAQIDARPKGGCGHTALQICAMLGNERLVEILLRKGADINAPAGVFRGRTALQASAQHSDTKLLITMLREGAEVNAPPAEQKGRTALQIAVAAGNTEGVRMLLDAGADVNANPKLTEGLTALQEAIRISDLAIRDEMIHLLLQAVAYTENHHTMVKLLVQHGAGINGLPSPHHGRTALQEAASSSFIQLTQYLLDHGAQVNMSAAHIGGVTALQGAAIHGNIRIGRDAISGAAENGRLDTLHLLLNYHPDTEEFEIRKKQAAKLALANGHLAIGRFLLAYHKHSLNV
ncbi:ankyrin repeat-containing domain protein [Aspergillus keveii]|uniref:protein S-acyltransferase n=1 Tax=Aspergillus keveii TaxID=714993 RepID=A0ABR4FZL8_9EURO